MLNVSIRRKILLLMLVAVLAMPWPSVAGSQSERSRMAQIEEPATLDFFSRIWSLLQSAGSKEGCHIDPNGRCTPQNPPSQTKEGCHIDPDGRCVK